jgi:hypothetical protein
MLTGTCHCQENRQHTTTTIGATEFHEAVTEAGYAAANATPRD